MFTKLAVFSAAVLATVANADLLLTLYASQDCSGTAGPQAKQPTNACEAAQGASEEITCNSTTVVQSIYANADCSGEPAQSGAFAIGSCVGLQGSGQYMSAHIDSCV